MRSLEPAKVLTFVAGLAGLSTALVLASTEPTQAHPLATGGTGFLAGLAHPLSGLDHVIAMVGVGLWAALRGGRALWVLPATFPLVMSAGVALGLAGVILPGPETAVALTGLLLGLALVSNVRGPLWMAACAVGLFGIIHGYVHGREIPAPHDAGKYVIGFITATVLLHAAGIILGLMRRWPLGQHVVQGVGVAIVAAGSYFLWSAVLP